MDSTRNVEEPIFTFLHRMVEFVSPPIRILHPMPCHRFDARTHGRSPVSGRFRMSAVAKDPTVLIPCLEQSAQGPSGGPAVDRARLNTVEHAAVPQVHTPDDRLQGSQQGGELSR